MAEELTPTAFTIEVAVTSDDVDHNGHMSNMTVVRLINHVSLAHSESVGWDIPRYYALGCAFVVRRHEIDYRAMAFLGDRLLVSTWVVFMERARAERRQRVVRASDRIVVAEARNSWVYVDAGTGRPQRIPVELIHAFVPRDST